MARHRRLLANQALRLEQEGQNEHEPDQDRLKRATLSLECRRHDFRDERAACAPQSPYDQRAEKRALVVTASTHDQHRPDLKSDDGNEVEGTDETDEPH